MDTDTAPTAGSPGPTASQPDNETPGGGTDADVGSGPVAPERSDSTVNNDGRTLTDAIDAAAEGNDSTTTSTEAEPVAGAALPVASGQPATPVQRPVTPLEPGPADTDAPSEPTATDAESEGDSPFELVPVEPAEEEPAPESEAEPASERESESTEESSGSGSDQGATTGDEPASTPDATPDEEPAPDADKVDGQPDQEASGETDTDNEPSSETSTPPTGISASPNTDSDTEDTSSTIGQTFSSANTDGFTGQVLDDGSIRVTWPEDSTARGYNLYRQGEYLLSVFDGTEHVDEDTTDGSFYYEVQAFDFDENYQYIARGLTVKVQGSGRENPQRRSGPGVDLADYDLVFSDEFNDNALDLGKWNTSYLWGDGVVINSEEQHYVDIENKPDFGFDPFTFDDGALVINAVPTPDSLAAKANDQPYLSGVITSYDAFKFTYGYAEARARVPFGKGLWAAFWLLNADYGDPDPADPEIDIMEHIGDNQDVVFHTYHYFDEEDKLRSTPSHPVKGIDFTADFHTFAVDWRPGVIVFYIDGIETKRIIDPNVSSQEMYVIANTALGGWWPGSPDATTQFPARYAIDYIRVYQKRTSYDDAPLFNDRAPPIPFADDSGLEIPYSDDPTQQSPNHRPPFDLFPGGDPRL